MPTDEYMIDYRQLRTLRQAALEIGVAPKTLSARANAGELRVFKTGGVSLVLMDEVEELSFRDYPRG